MLCLRLKGITSLASMFTILVPYCAMIKNQPEIYSSAPGKYQDLFLTGDDKLSNFGYPPLQ